MKIRTLSLLAAWLLLPFGAAAAVHLQVGTVGAVPGSPVEVPVRVTTDGEPIGAVVFALAFDQTRLQFDSAAKDGNRLENVSMELPSGYRASSSVMRVQEQEAVVISFWAPPGMASLSTSYIRLRFETAPGAGGTGWVRVLPGASASSASGDLVEVTGSEGGATFQTGASFLSASPALLDFGRMEAGTSRTAHVALTNTGSTAATVSGISGLENGLSAATSLPLIIPPGATVGVPLTFDAVGDGARQWVVVFSSQERETVVAVHATVGDAGGATLPTRRWIIPAAVRSAGENVTWRTSLSLHAADAAAPGTTLTFVGQDRKISRTIDLLPRETVTFDDLVDWIAPAHEGSGYILVESSSPSLLLRSFTVREEADGSTSEMIRVPALRWTSLGGFDQSVVLSQRATLRLDAGIVNYGNETLQVTLEVLDANGNPLEMRHASVEPGSTVRINGLVSSAAAAVRAHTGSNGGFLLWTSQRFEDGSSIFDVAR